MNIGKHSITKQQFSKMSARYNQQIGNIQRRTDNNGNKIKMKLTLLEWCEIWLDSGHWEQRSNKGSGYCMSRFNDIGHYATGNVEIKTNHQNKLEAHKGAIRPAGTGERIIKAKTKFKHTKETKEKMSNAHKGKKFTDEHKARIGAKNKGRIKTLEELAHFSKVTGNNKTCKINGIVYRSGAYAASQLGFTKHQVYKKLNSGDFSNYQWL